MGKSGVTGMSSVVRLRGLSYPTFVASGLAPR